MVQKLLSGGQTGADRAALDFAIACGLPHGGWCPLGRLAEDGIIPARYQLSETPTADFPQRTEWNVRDSDGTVIFSIQPLLTGGSRLTCELAEQNHKPCLHLSRDRDGPAAVGKLTSFLRKHRIKVLNVAGSRQSQEPEVSAFTHGVLAAALGHQRETPG